MDQKEEISMKEVEVLIAQYQTARIRTLWKSYKRIFQLKNSSIVTLDPSTFAPTHNFPYAEITRVNPDEKNNDHFTIELEKQGSFVFKTAHRSQLLCQLFECCTKATSKFRSFGPFRIVRLRKNSIQTDGMLSAAPYGVIEYDLSCRVLQEYKFVNITKIGVDNLTHCLFFESSGRIKIFKVEYIDQFIAGLKQQLHQLGLTWIPFLMGQKLGEITDKRLTIYSNLGASVAQFDVYKPTKRYNRQLPRQFHVTEEFIIEKDHSGSQFISYYRLDRIYALVRSWDSQKEFKIEFDDGSSRIYYCNVRDTLLAILLDVSHAVGNLRIIVTGEVSDSLRLMPRFAEEDYQVTLSDTFFGTDSIESWFLKRLSKASKHSHLNIEEILTSCGELNANVPCPGISSNSDVVQVKYCLSGICRSLQYFIQQYIDYENDDSNPVGTHVPRSMVVLLQTLYRILASLSGFKFFVDVRDVDPRLILVQLLHEPSDFVNYWTLQVLMALCRCQQPTRHIQQEFVNKHTLLTDTMLGSLVGLMSTRIEGETFDMPEELPTLEGDDVGKDTYDRDANDVDGPKPSLHSTESDSMEREKTASRSTSVDLSKVDLAPEQTNMKVPLSTLPPVPPPPEMPSPSPREALGKEEGRPESRANSINNSRKESSASKDGMDGHRADSRSNSFQNSRKDSLASKEIMGMNSPFTRRASVSAGDNKGTTSRNPVLPNSLVIVGAAALLESILSSNRDTSSPELMNKVLDLLSARCEVLVHMLRSTSFLIMENASILMHVLLKNRPMIAATLQETALSECLVLKHFYAAMFSPSSSQRFISRFLISNWMSGSEDTEGKKLLRRMIPSGLLEYLKYSPINDAQRETLDAIEEEYYTTHTGSRKNNSNALTRLHGRMKKRITIAQGNKNVDPSDNINTNESKPGSLMSGNVDGERSSSNVYGQVKSVSIAGSSTSSTGSLSVSSIQQTQQTATATSTTSTPVPMIIPKSNFENFRIMFHVMTQDHQLPDLIWNEHTRLELRSALESELSSFEREQRLRGLYKVAWNFQHFAVRYDSLRDELRVGTIYVRYYLDAGDAFLRTLQNPTPSVLFEKLMRRVLVNVEKNSRLAVLSTRCLTRLYGVCKDMIGPFDDMMLVVRMLEQAQHLELQHCLIDLLEKLSQTETNLLQLLEAEFVTLMFRYCSLAHLNPDQIGNILARATGKVLLITQGEEDMNGTIFTNGFESSTESSASAGNTTASSERNAHIDERRRSLWIPEDSACPRMWFVASPGALPPPVSEQRGPFRVTELVSMLDRGLISTNFLVAPACIEDYDSDHYEAVVDTGRWKLIKENFQLRIQILCPGHPIYSPAEITYTCLNVLYRLADLHKPTNSHGVLFHPTPTSKRLMSDQEQLSTLAQLLLCNDPKVVEVSVQILRNLVEFNAQACSKLYLTGLFFFICKYSGNNFTPLAELLDVTHLRQSFHDSIASIARELSIGERSILGRILPPAVINILVNYGPEKFASVFTGEADTPEVIWNAVLRKHTVEMINQHLGDFSARLRQHTLGRYEYCPIPRIHYLQLEKELYCHDYYLKNLCDEIRFPNWPISQPLQLLRDTIERWRVEMSKSVEDKEVVEARQILNLQEGFDNTDLRRAYKAMARQYHPDKNPNGRDMFERIHKAYELLSSIQLEVNYTDYKNVVIIIKTQIIVYRRNPEAVRDQKYPAYRMLVKVMDVPLPIPSNSNTLEENEGNVAEETAGEDTNQKQPSYPKSFDTLTQLDLLQEGTKLIFYTVSVSPYNAEEFVRAGALPKLFQIFLFALNTIGSDPDCNDKFNDIILFSSKSFAAITRFSLSFAHVHALLPEFAVAMYRVLRQDRRCPLAVENCIETISNCAADTLLQNSLVGAGVIWRLIPFLLCYDSTLLRLDSFDEDQRAQHNQHSSNSHAELSAKALGRLAGVMFDDLRTPPNPLVINALGRLLTFPLAKLLRNRRPGELLDALNENIEKPTKIWNVNMRTELLTFVLQIDKNRPEGMLNIEEDLGPSNDFLFTALRNELCVDGVYLRVFNKTGDTADIDDPSKFCAAVITFIRSFLPSIPATVGGEHNWNGIGVIETVSDLHKELAVESLRLLVERLQYIAIDISKSLEAISVIFDLLSTPPQSIIFSSTIQILSILATCPQFVESSCRQNMCVQSLLRASCSTSTTPTSLSVLWGAIEGFSAMPDGLGSLLRNGAVPLLLGVIFNIPGFNSSYQNRLSAVSLLSKFLWNPMKGAETYGVIRRFLPDPVVTSLRAKSATWLSSVIDVVSETPELIWTLEMQSELRQSLIELLLTSQSNYSESGQNASESSSTNHMRINWTPTFSVGFHVIYRQIAAELYIGGVYVRLFLRQPTFLLSNPVMFLEGLIARWEESFDAQIPEAIPDLRNSGHTGGEADSYALIVGKEDFLSLITSAIVCVIKSESTLTDHMISWGFADKSIELLKRALDGGCRGTPVTSVTRLLHQMMDRTSVADALSTASCNAILQLTRILDEADVIGGVTPHTDVKLPKEATFCTELLKKIFTLSSPRSLSTCCSAAVSCKLPYFLADFILGKSIDDPIFRSVRNPSALRVHAVDLLKIVSGSDAKVQLYLDKSSSWKEFSNQSHDLFITQEERMDPFLLEDSSEKRFAGLLTDGSASGKISEVSPYLTSSGRAPSPSTIPESYMTNSMGVYSSIPGNRNSIPTANAGLNSSTISTANNSMTTMTSTNQNDSTSTNNNSNTTGKIDKLKSLTPSSKPKESHGNEISVKVFKGKHGVGLDLCKGIDGRAVVQRLKTMPPGVPNPCLVCEPSVLAGDVILAVNGEKCENFVDTVKKIRDIDGNIVFTLSRTF